MRSEICRGTPEVLQQEAGVAGTDQQTTTHWSLVSYFCFQFLPSVLGTTGAVPTQATDGKFLAAS